MADDLSQAIELIQAGKKAEGGRILAGLVRSDPDNELVWQWLSACVVPEAQKRHCLGQVLRINPGNEYAKKTLSALDFQPVFEAPPAVEKPAPKAEKKVKSAYPARTKICPLCKSEMPANAVLCPHCGKNAGMEQSKAIGRLGFSLIQLAISIPILLLMLWCLWSVVFAK